MFKQIDEFCKRHEKLIIRLLIFAGMCLILLSFVNDAVNYSLK